MTQRTQSIEVVNSLSAEVISCAINVHKELGPGLLESAYRECLFYELIQQGLFVQKEVPMPLVFKEVKLECGYRVDLIVENNLVIELKAAEALTDVHLAQTLTYLRLGNFKRGLLINFNVARLKDGIKRIIN